MPSETECGVIAAATEAVDTVLMKFLLFMNSYVVIFSLKSTLESHSGDPALAEKSGFLLL